MGGEEHTKLETANHQGAMTRSHEMENSIGAGSMCDGDVFGDGQKKEARRVATWSDLPSV